MALTHPIAMLPDETKSPFAPTAAIASYTPAFSPISPLTQPTPQYGWGSEVGYAAAAALAQNQARMSNSGSPASSEHSMRSFRSSHTPLHLSPSLSSASTSSSQDSPMPIAATPPLWDDGEPYKPAPILPVDNLQSPRVDLAPLETLPRGHVYRRCPADDRALRLLALAPGAR